jgi:SSS family solute:Na+ symporter
MNAWSEITAMIAAAIGYGVLKTFTNVTFPFTLLIVVAWTTLCWVIVTLVTPPEPDAHLIAFYRRTRPDGPGWTRIAALAGEPAPGSVRGLLLDWAAGVVVVYAALFGIGHALLGSAVTAAAFFVAVIAGISVLARRSKVSPATPDV